MMSIALPFDVMADGTKRLTIEVPEDLHEAFLRKCFLEKPRATMKDRIIAFMAAETGKPVPKSIDRRKLTREERERLDRPSKPPRR